ncbi:Kinase-like protein [Mycena venus]|uniref:Kinase-like protein n=1 Tax=Mycena venus TaxID=2733690 RepID=A0A8H6U0N7_9AGAR|nr:Kinase-like protein [Mycena venus]
MQAEKTLDFDWAPLSSDLGLGLAHDQKLQTALVIDEQLIATFVPAICKFEEEAVLRLEDDSAQCFLDVAQGTLQQKFLKTRDKQRILRLIRKLSESRGKKLPSSYPVTRDRHATVDQKKIRRMGFGRGSQILELSGMKHPNLESYDNLVLPSSPLIAGVNRREKHPTFAGGFADIFRAFYDGKPVALKRMRYFLASGPDMCRIHSKFRREAFVWRDLYHPHILPFIGIDQDSFPPSLCMVSPWMEHGTVLNYLNVHGPVDIDKLLYEIALGLEYLHSLGIVHGDLKGANILINDERSACLADFGLSQIADATLSMSTTRGGSLYWMAPELIDPDHFGCQFARTRSSDVYAFGCVCFEVYTGRPPFANLPELAAMMKIVNGERPARPTGSPVMSDTLWRYVSTYWADNPAVRPEAQLVVKNLTWPAPLQNLSQDGGYDNHAE